MANRKDGDLTNSELFKKYRFKSKTDEISDEHIITHGRLIESEKPPFQFYNGWYPYRRNCSFPQHPVERGAGISTEKDAYFSQYRVMCKVCDSSTVSAPNIEKNTGCGDMFCKPNSVASKKMLSQKASCVQRNPPYATQQDGPMIKNTHWRLHDPHKWEKDETIPASSNVHKSNWFYHDMDNRCLLTKFEREQRRVQCLEKQRKKCQDLRIQKLYEQNERELKKRQLKSSFNNPLKGLAVPLPGPPTSSKLFNDELQKENIIMIDTTQDGETTAGISTSQNVPEQSTPVTQMESKHEQ